MNRLFKYSLVVALLATAVLNMFSCKHYLDFDIPVTPPVDTTHYDTCAAGVISFTEDVLPILLSNCAKSGCHDAASHREGVIMTSYSNVISTGRINPNNPLSNKFWRSITGNNDIMPPPPDAPLTQAQQQLIQQWLQQGAQNTTCTHHTGCDTTNVSFSQYIYPVVQTYCLGCHQGSSAYAGVDLAGYTNVVFHISSGKFMQSIRHETGTVAMPYNAQKLDDCTINKFQSWINAGMPNN